MSLISMMSRNIRETNSSWIEKVIFFPIMSAERSLRDDIIIIIVIVITMGQTMVRLPGQHQPLNNS